MHKPAESIIRPAFVLMSGRAVGFIAAFIIPLVLVRVFDQTGFGTYKQIFLIYGTLFGIVQLGMAESLYYFLPNDMQKTGKYVLNSIVVLGLAGLLCLVVLSASGPAISSWLNNPELEQYILLIGIFLLLMLMAVVLEIVMTVHRKNLLASGTYALSDIVRAILCIVPALVFGELKWLLYGMITFAAFRLVVTLFYLRHELGQELAVDTGLLKNHLAYAIPFGIAAIIEIAYLNLHLYAVSFHFDAATFAIYAVGCFQIPLFDLLMTSTSNVLMVNMREKVIQGDFEAVRKMWHDTTRKLVLIFCLIVGGLLAIANEFIVLLFTSNYAESVPIFMVWTVSIVFAGFLTDAVLRVHAQNRFLILLNSFKLLLLMVSINWFLTRYNLMGAVMVMLLVVFTGKLLALARVKFLLQSRLVEFLPWHSLAMTIIITIAAAMTAITLKATLDLSVIPTLMITGVTYTCTFIALLLLTEILGVHEKLTLLNYAKSPVSSLGWNWKFISNRR